MPQVARNVLEGSILLLISFNIFNLLNFVYHFVMARMLEVSEYGALVSILALYTLMLIPSEAAQNTIIRYVSLNKNEPGKVKNIMKRSLRRFSFISFAAFIFFILLAYPLSIYMKIGYFAIAVSGFAIFGAFFSSVPRGVLLGEKKYASLGYNVILDGSLKIILSVALIFFVGSLGLSYLKVHGAVLGVVFASLIALFFSFFPLKKIIHADEEKADVHDIYMYVRPAFFITLAIFAFLGIDIIIAKIFFDPESAGIYAIASTLGKIIFFVTGPISKAMFPLTSGESAQTKKSQQIFLYSGFLLFFIILAALAVYYFFPGLLVLLFSGKSLPLATTVLFKIALASSFISIANLALLYRLSLGKTKGSFFLGFFIVFEIVLLSLYSQSIQSFSFAFLLAATIFLIGSIILLKYE